VEEDLRRRWGVDVLPIDRYYAAPGVRLTGRFKAHPLPDGEAGLFPEEFQPRFGEDGSWELWEGGRAVHRLSPGSGSFVPAFFPLAGANLEALEAYPLAPIGDEELSVLHRRARLAWERTDYALFGWIGGSIFEQAQFLCGWDDFMMRLAAEPRFAERLLERLTEWVVGDVKRYLEAVGEYLQVVGFGDDFGFQNGLLVKPRLERIYSTVHRESGAKVLLHSCGSVHDLIEDFIEIGVDVLNPVQTSAAGMEPERLGRKFGGRMVFWGGGADVQEVLPRGTPSQVRRDVQRRLEAFGDGFVFAPIHNLQADIPPENIAAMYDAAASLA
jgi:uroporphyrinogen decarboxylase